MTAAPVRVRGVSMAIQRVDFYQGDLLIGTSTGANAQYVFTWNDVPAGSYTFTARASDAQNATVSSTPVSVTVGTAQQQPQLYFIHPDHLNTPRVITDARQQVVWRWDNNDPFGNNAPNENPSGAGNFTCNLRLPGQYFDRETNLNYNYFRDYDPSIGRYVQSDPIGLRGGINTFAYVKNKPLRFADPKGLLIRGGGCSDAAWRRLKSAEASIRGTVGTYCSGCGDGAGCIPCKYRNKLLDALDTSIVSCGLTASPSGACANADFPGTGTAITFFPIGFTPPCSCLPATLLHEVMHIGGLGDADHQKINFFEVRCFPSCAGDRGYGAFVPTPDLFDDGP